jgi:hypothetical protein
MSTANAALKAPIGVGSSAWLGGMVANPRNHFLGIPVRWEYWIDAMQNTPVCKYQSQALEQTHTFNLERRQLQSGRKLTGGVA